MPVYNPSLYPIGLTSIPLIKNLKSGSKIRLSLSSVNVAFIGNSASRVMYVSLPITTE